MPHIKITNRFTNGLIHEGQFSSVRECLLDAIQKGADLKDADLKDACLEGACLEGAYLEGADLKDADLKDADLEGACLKDADLKGACLEGAYLEGADLKDADLKDADLEGACLKDACLEGADLEGADLKDACLEGADLEAFVNGKLKHDLLIPKIENIHQSVYNFAQQEGSFEMCEWHSSCGTSHCWGGTIVHLAEEAGYQLEQKVGTRLAALLINAKSSGIQVEGDWFTEFSNSQALSKMKEFSEKEQSTSSL